MNLRAHPETDKSGIDGDQPAGLAHRGNNWRDVERTQNAHIDNFGRAADLVQNVSRAHGLKDTMRRCDDGDVFAFADNARTIERILVVALGHVAGRIVEKPVLDEDHRIVVFNGRDQHSLGVGGESRHHDLEAGEICKQRLKALRVLGALAPAAPDHHTNDQRHLVLAIADVRSLRGVVHDLLECEQRELHTMKADDRPLTGNCSPDRDTDRAIFGDRHLDDAILAEFVADAFQCAPHR